MAKIQKVIRKQSESYSVVIPLKIMEEIGWTKGTNVSFSLRSEKKLLGKNKFYLEVRESE
jgi:antitoxin component of MazEF toxin-antitoxin module